ncbi:MAG: hypothetical protein SOZ70_01960 [Bacilli bacterium]|nr:hypothetical protein [Bacilli bacterium]
MEFKIKPTTNGYVVEFTVDNKKGKDQNLKIWIDSKAYRTILLNPDIPDADKLFFVQSEYREKQD